MQTLKKFQEILPKDIAILLKTDYFSLMASFYETQSSFLTNIYQRYNSIESANIILCFARNTHLEIIRQREKNLNFDVSLERFVNNFNLINKPSEKIISIVQLTGIPKETVRRKIKNLLNLGYLINNKDKNRYSWQLSSKDKDAYHEIINGEIEVLSKFVFKFSKSLKLNLDLSMIREELKSQFSFYWYHFLSSQLLWLKRWQLTLKDNDLLLIILQTIIPSIQYADKTKKNINLDNIPKIVGKINDKYDVSKIAVSATAVSEVTRIPRATCIRKLEKLVTLGFLLRETKTKRYYVNQNIESKTKNIVTSETVKFTIETFSQFLAIILNSLSNYKK